MRKQKKKNKSEGFFKDEAKIKDRYFMNIGKNNSYKNFLNVSQISKLKDSFGEYIEKYNLWFINLKNSLRIKKLADT